MINGTAQNCYLCGNNELVVLRTRLRHDISRNVLECKNCGIVYLEPKGSDLKNFYGYEYRKLYTPVIGDVLNSKEIFDAYLPYQQKRIDEIRDIISSQMRVLEIGCAAGFFLYTLKDIVQECIGLEFNKENVEFVEKELGIKVYSDPIEKTDLPYEHFDMITIYQAFEHIEDPIGFLKTISLYLKNDGFLCIEVPNVQDALLAIYKNEAYAGFYYRDPHIFYYSSETLTRVLKAGGFEGNTKLIQKYNFLNHLNWILTGKPQKDPETGRSKSKLIHSASVNKEIAGEFNQWIQKVDAEYKELLNRHGFSDDVLFIGKKIKI